MKTDIKDGRFSHGDIVRVGLYEIELRRIKYDSFSLESRATDAATWKCIDPFFWPVYIMDFLHGVFRK